MKDVTTLLRQARQASVLGTISAGMKRHKLWNQITSEQRAELIRLHDARLQDVLNPKKK